MEELEVMSLLFPLLHTAPPAAGGDLRIGEEFKMAVVVMVEAEVNDCLTCSTLEFRRCL